MTGSEIFIGLYLDHSQVMAYVCDGFPPDTPWTVKEWFTGPVTNGLVAGTLKFEQQQCYLRLFRQPGLVPQLQHLRLVQN